MELLATKVDKDKEHPCGTVACFAGHIVLMKFNKYGPRQQKSIIGDLSDGYFHQPFSWVGNAQKELGITSAEADKLFMLFNWPQKFKDGYNWKSPRAKARTAVRRLEHFIKYRE